MTKDKEQKKSTLQKRINTLLQEHELESNVKLKADIIDLIERVTHPASFCPQCDSKMLFDTASSTMDCLNCGYKGQPARPDVRSLPQQRPQPSGDEPPVKRELPAQLEEKLKEAERTTKALPIGDKIRKLRDQIDSGTAPPTKQDESRIKGLDPNVKDVNWV